VKSVSERCVPCAPEYPCCDWWRGRVAAVPTVDLRGKGNSEENSENYAQTAQARTAQTVQNRPKRAKIAPIHPISTENAQSFRKAAYNMPEFRSLHTVDGGDASLRAAGPVVRHVQR
jgi:hypothetical protein